MIQMVWAGYRIADFSRSGPTHSATVDTATSRAESGVDLHSAYRSDFTQPFDSCPDEPSSYSVGWPTPVLGPASYLSLTGAGRSSVSAPRYGRN